MSYDCLATSLSDRENQMTVKEGFWKKHTFNFSANSLMAILPVKCSLQWLLLWLGLWVMEIKTVGSLDEDHLSPYDHGHGPSHSHRHVRDCQLKVHGNVTHETWPASAHAATPLAQSKTFVTRVSDAVPRWVNGHVTVVHDPLRMVSVLEPGGPGGCQRMLRVPVEQSASGARCLYAQNGGFFNTHSGDCLGNVVSNGVLVKDSGGLQNAQFGIRRDGTLVFGYLSGEDVLDKANPFVQLISGVVWLLRDGQIYINQSIEAECDKTQETGSFRRFVDVVSARTAVGHDAEGNLILFHIDGKTDNRGMTLWEVADFLKSEGVINAINLDGGGSSTYVVNGSLASYPSDPCTQSDHKWLCPRPVSTILCVHQPLCQPEDCSGHGACVDGNCQCHQGWKGAGCDALVCQAPTCGAHGVCTQDGCTCDAGWTGETCSQACAPGFYGDDCNQTCTCTNGGSCDPVHGICACPAGFQGKSCEQDCPLGFFGLNCRQECQCQDMCPCDPATGSCDALFQGDRNRTIHQAGHCLANQMIARLREEEEEHKPHLTELTWFIITTLLTSLLLASGLGHLVRACRGPAGGRQPSRKDYSYTPLTDINGSSGGARVRGEGSRASGRGLDGEDSDSQDEVWSQRVERHS
ncbi:N-acetylglucosamine-1-phosphodiester alpha-N-acetylglucosaminidase [Osmerus mordax]|uniref:N-acetylglucosamine-1-phosphodiester alpha-N-acetylglucosaminidase n=1 Tax=Osmerus mordax TaxID=8014 RepID=UPI0035106EDE